jgi:transposase
MRSQSGCLVSSAVKWSQHDRAAGSIAPGRMGGWREFAARGVYVPHNAVWPFLRREGLRFSKHCTLMSKVAPTSPTGVETLAEIFCSRRRAQDTPAKFR